MLTPLIEPTNEPFAQIGGAKKRKGTKGKKTKGRGKGKGRSSTRKHKRHPKKHHKKH